MSDLDNVFLSSYLSAILAKRIKGSIEKCLQETALYYRNGS